MNMRSVQTDFRDVLSATEFTAEEIAEARRCITQAFQILEDVTPDYVPEWLLNEWNAPIWKTDAGSKTRMFEGEWVGTLNIYWDVLLPNGARLTDKKYSRLLQTCRRACVLYRDGVVGDTSPAISTWAVFCTEIKRLCLWCVLHEQTFRPDTHGFSLIDHSSLGRLLNLLAKGGWTEALLIPERVVGALYMNAFGRCCSPELQERPWSLPQDECEQICRWLAAHKGYSNHSWSRGLVSRKFLASQINCDMRAIVCMSVKLNAVIRQFEPIHKNENGLLYTRTSCEYPSHRAITIEDAFATPMSPSCVEGLTKATRVLFELHSHFPEMMPDPSGIELKKLKRTADRITAPQRHTPFIPIPIGLKYLGEALRWVDEYGDELVDLYLDVAKEMKRIGPNQRLSAAAMRKLKARIRISPALSKLGDGLRRIYPNQSKGMDFDAFRSRPTLSQAIECLVGVNRHESARHPQAVQNAFAQTLLAKACH